jgi:hypothetical protein
MLLKKIHLLKNKISEHVYSENISIIIEDIEKKFSLKIKNLEESFDSFKEDNIIKNVKIDELNKKIAYYEKETKALSQDFIAFSGLLVELYKNVEVLVSSIENNMQDPDMIFEEDFDKKKKTYH